MPYTAVCIATGAPSLFGKEGRRSGAHNHEVGATLTNWSVWRSAFLTRLSALTSIQRVGACYA